MLRPRGNGSGNNQLKADYTFASHRSVRIYLVTCGGSRNNRQVREAARLPLERRTGMPRHFEIDAARVDRWREAERGRGAAGPAEDAGRIRSTSFRAGGRAAGPGRAIRDLPRAEEERGAIRLRRGDCSWVASWGNPHREIECVVSVLQNRRFGFVTVSGRRCEGR